MAEPFTVLRQLEERVKRAETVIPELKKQAQDTSTAYAQAMDRNEQLSSKLKKYEEVIVHVKSIFSLVSEIIGPAGARAVFGYPSVSTATTGSRDMEVKDPSRIIEVADPQEPLQVNTTELRGQIAKLILDGSLAKGLLSAKSVRGQLLQEFGKSAEQWDIDTITTELKELGSPPYRLFIYTSNRMFRLRAGSEKRVKG